MAVTVKFFIFAHGNVVRGEEGASYDRDPLRKIRLKTDATYTDLLNAICTGVRIDPTTHQLKVHHRHPKSVEGRVHYSLVPILDDDDVKDLIEMAENLGEGSIQELFVEISDRSIPSSEHETHQVVATMPSTSQMPRSKRDPMTGIEDFTPKRARYEMHLSKDINDMEQEINCVLENPLIETSKNLIVADLRNEDPSQHLMIHKSHDPPAFPMPPSSISMDIADEMEDGNRPSRASSSTTPPPGQDYEVFLSFRGKDTRYGFTDHLYNGLVNVGVLVFRDDNELRVGEEIGPELLKAIKASRISIPIISENYASSSWCLQELVQILECMKTSRQVVLPIFYQVEPSEVRNQTGNFGNGFLESENKHYGKESLIQKWKNALRDVTSLKGWESSKIANGHEGELVRVIVHKVLQVLRKVPLPINDHLVGAEDNAQKIIERITNAKKPNDVQAILIHGMGGIGKTTLAKVVYNQLCDHFEHCSFIANIRATSQQHKGMEDLQKQLISNILGQQQNISNIDDGATIIKARCNRKKVLILLDDINHRDQLDALVGPDWFGRGTVIIITSRRKDLLENWEDRISYELKELNSNQSFMLFCKHAFKRSDSIPDEYTSIAKEIVSTTGGLPLAIEVIGSLLYRKGKSFWEGNLKILKEIPHHEVQKKLKISFDALEQEEKEIFLDIACLKIDAREREYAFHMWDSCGFCRQVRIENLISLSLIKSEENGELIIHDQLRDLGREIVRQESIDDPGQRTRIWKKEDAFEVLELNKGTQEIQILYQPDDMTQVRCTSKQFKRMTKLRYLHICEVDLEGDFENLFQNLRWLYWCGGKLDFMGSNFIPKKLVVLYLYGVNIIEEWMGWSQMKHLKVLRLGGCNELISLPDISALKELEVLILVECENLRNIHPCIVKLKLLTVLDLSGTKVTQLPDSIGDLFYLELLGLTGTEVTQLPDSIGDLCNLELLYLQYTPIRCLPTSIRMLSKLQTLYLSHCYQLLNLPNSLTSLMFDGDLIETLPDFSNLTNLEYLLFTHDFRRWNTTLNFRDLNRITTLRLGCNGVQADSSDPKECYAAYSLRDCSDKGFKSVHINLQLELPSTLVNLILNDCYTLRTLPNFSDSKNLCVLSIKNCPELMNIDGLDGAESLTSVMIYSCKKLSKLGGMGISVTHLELRYLDSLVSLPNLSTAKKLMNLRICDCRNLIEIQGLDNVEGIESVVIDGCSSLEIIGDLSNLKMLTTLELCNCEKLLEIRGMGISVMYLKLEQLDSLVSLPDLSTAKKLKNLRLCSCRNLVEIQGLDNVESIESVEIIECSSLERISDLSHLKMLGTLEFSYCEKLSEIGEMGISVINLSTAKKLKNLRLRSCKNLVEIQGLDNAEDIDCVVIDGYSSLERIGNLSNLKMLSMLELCNCEKLSNVQGIEKLTSLTSLSFVGCHPKIKFLDLSMLGKLKNLRIKFPDHQNVHIVEESCEISLRCPALERLPDNQNVHIIAEPLEEQEGGYMPDLSRFKISTNMIEEICEISLGCPAFGRFPNHENVRTIVESLEEKGGGYVPDLSQFKNSNDIVEESCEISLGSPALGRLSNYQSVCIVAKPLEEQGSIQKFK